MSVPSFNKVFLMGNLGADAECRYTPGGKAVATFPMATSETWKGADGNPASRVHWHHITMWGTLAQTAAKYLKKGQSVFVEGRLVPSSYTDKEGIKRQKVEVCATAFQFLPSGGKGKGKDRVPGEEEDVQWGGSKPGASTGPASLDDLPF